MSSENRSSSAVRNLRSLFENKATLPIDSSSPDSRGRSPSGVGGSDKENGYRPRSKVRASFVPVELAGGMAAVERRGSFSETDGDGALSELKRTVSEQQKSRFVPEAAIESAAATPMKKPGGGRLGHDMPADNPDKPVTGEQDARDMKPADPASESAVSGGSALPPVSEDLRSKTAGKKADSKNAIANGKPAAISTKAPPKASASAVKSPASQPKTPTSSKPATTTTTTSTSTASPSLKAPLKKPSRSSLTAPTAASMARSGAVSDSASSTKTSPTAKPKPREVTKPANVSSHLLAPTAASRAKHEPETAPAPAAPRSTVTSRPKATTPAKAAPRASMGPRPASRDSASTSRKSINPPDSSFLERMSKPTAASINRNAKEAEVKSPPKTSAKPAAPAAKPKANGTKAAPKAPAAAPEHEEPVEATPVLETAPAAPAAATPGIEEEPTFAEAVKERTATPNGESETQDAGLEATPAALGGEETIR